MTAQSPPRWVRPVVGVVVVIVWIAIAGLGGPYFGRIGEVSVNDQASYLPSSAESTQVQKRFTDFFGDSTIPAVVVAERAGGMTVGGHDLAPGAVCEPAGADPRHLRWSVSAHPVCGRGRPRRSSCLCPPGTT